MGWAKLQMVVFSLAAAAASVAGLVYIFVAHPAYLRTTTQGVPYYTPKVADPLTNKPLDLGMLIRHYEGKDAQ
ncbi:MAG: hypothetical protein ACM3QY_00995 [Candidatus Levyibacteriota bacterium]